MRGDRGRLRCATYSVMVSGVAGNGRRPTREHQAVKASMSAE
ncbi:hypothetical protein [Streptomyces sp. NPDC002788]